MTVQELIDQLNKLPRDMQVWTQKDGEGNAFRHIAAVKVEKMCSTSEECNASTVHPSDYDEYNDLVDCVVIKPTY